MLWEVDIRPLGRDAERERVCDEFDLLTHATRGGDLVRTAGRGFLLEGIDRSAAERLVSDLLVDSVVEHATLAELGHIGGDRTYTVLLKPGVMDPVAESVLGAAADLGVPLAAVRTFRRYEGTEALSPSDRDLLFRKVLANDAIEQIAILLQENYPAPPVARRWRVGGAQQGGPAGLEPGGDEGDSGSFHGTGSRPD
jgi:phosphoribosylformylglycinamidine (FGAM) synthase PurS component